MNETIKENSPLELYETAYALHYVDGNIPEACRLYKAIIDDFPSSNECGYAVIQLQKIQANDVADGIRASTNRFAMIQIIAVTLCIVVCLTLSVAAFLSLKKARSDLEALSLVSQAISMLYAGNDTDALEILNKAKAVSRGAMSAPYLLAANIYINMQQFARARAEYDAYQRASGKSDQAFKKMVAIKSDKADKKILPVKTDSTPFTEASSVQASAVQEAPTPAPAVAKQPLPEKAPIKIKPKMEKIKPARSPRTGPRSSPNSAPDTISFF
jgi:tetratricopeptide (TPR) repeat protein